MELQAGRFADSRHGVDIAFLVRISQGASIASGQRRAVLKPFINDGIAPGDKPGVHRPGQQSCERCEDNALSGSS